MSDDSSGSRLIVLPPPGRDTIERIEPASEPGTRFIDLSTGENPSFYEIGGSSAASSADQPGLGDGTQYGDPDEPGYIQPPGGTVIEVYSPLGIRQE